MRIGFFQYAVFYRDREANLEYISRRLNGEIFDLLVLPELFTSGYSCDDSEEMRRMGEYLDDSPTVKALTEIAASCGGAILGSIPELADDVFYNTGVLVNASGLLGSQRKIHLPDHEKKVFTCGNSITAFSVEKTKIGIMTCFDCWFPAFGALLKQQGVGIFCVPSSFGGAATPTILPIRARENQVFVVNCNRIGKEHIEGVEERFRGQSQIISPDGEPLALGGDDEMLAFVTIDMAAVKHPAFVSSFCRDVAKEHAKYNVQLSCE